MHRSGGLNLEVLIWLSVILVTGMIAGISLSIREEKVLLPLDYILLLVNMLIVLTVWLRINKIKRDERND